MAMKAMARPEAWARGADRLNALALIRCELVREPLGGRTWRGALINRGDGLYADVAIDIRFLDRNGRAVGGLGGRVDRLAPGALLDLQSRLSAGATGLQVQSLRWSEFQLGPCEPWALDDLQPHIATAGIVRLVIPDAAKR